MNAEQARVMRPVLGVTAFRLQVAATVAGGLALLAWAGTAVTADELRRLGVAFAIVASLVLLGELRPLVTAGSRDVNGVTTSTAFVFALLLHWGLAVALLMQALAVVVADMVRRRAGWRSLFDVGQLALSWGAAGGVLIALGRHAGPEHPLTVHGSDLPAVAAAAAAFFVVNDAVVAQTLALRQRVPFRREFFLDFGYQVATTGTLLAMSPVVVLTIERGPALVPLLLPPLVAVYATASVSLEKEHQSLHDPLTGLPNRKLLLQRAHAAVARSVRADEPFAFMLLDLDRFKEVNDTLGHHVGDTVLQSVARRLSETVRPGDTVARLGGDEFGLLLPSVRDERAAREVAERVRRALDRPLRLGDTGFQPEASIGVALHPRHGLDFPTLMQRADVAMYLAKQAGTFVEVYTPETDPHSTSRLGLLAELRRAIERGRLELHYQPKAELRSGRVIGVEALLRWRHPERGIVLPEEFVPLAERSGLMRVLTRFVVDRALSQLSQWYADGIAVQVAINVSARDLYDPAFTAFLAERIAWHGALPSLVQLEITESAVMAEPTRAADTLRALARLGVGISLDDFGTGYSSLVHLRRLPVNEVKVDRTFVQRMVSDGDDAAIVRSIIDLGAALGLHVVAEGVETSDAWELLSDLGCDAAQGWYLARALTADEATAWLQGQRQPVPT